MDFDSLSTLMRENGIVGAGGAGFPSYAKLNKSVDTIIINCAECEPLLRLHRQLLERKAYEVLQTLDIIMKTTGAKKGIIALKRAYVKAIDALKQYIASYKDISICELKEVYPAGDEVVLIYEATGRVVQPGKLPISQGVIVYNVETIFNVYNAINNKPVTHKFITIAGEVKNPQTFYAPIGITYKELVDLAGGSLIDDPAYLIGGPMMGSIGREFDVVTKTSNAVILLPKDHYVVLRKQSNIKYDIKRAMSSCCQCSFCTDMCPRHMLGHPINPAEVMRVVTNQDSNNVEPYLNTFYCSGCGVCEMYACQQGLSPRTIIQAVKSNLRQQGVKPLDNIKEAVPVQNRNDRRVPLKRLRARLNLEKYNKSAPITDTKIIPNSVKIMLSQHVGVPATPIVKIGDYVKTSDVIGKAVNDKLSVNIHSSIDGKIVDVNSKFIVISNN